MQHDGVVIGSAVFSEAEARPAPANVVRALEAQSWPDDAPPRTEKLGSLGSYRVDSRVDGSDLLVVGVSVARANQIIARKNITTWTATSTWLASGRPRGARYDGIRLVEDSLDIETCEGAATIGLELMDTTLSFDAVLISLGGGALATGVGHVIKAWAPDVEVILHPAAGRTGDDTLMAPTARNHHRLNQHHR